MDLTQILSIGALVVAITTCAFVFLMYKRVDNRINGLLQANLGLSRTMQHLVSASMANHQHQRQTENQQYDEGTTSVNDTASDMNTNNDEVKTLTIGGSLPRIPVSDDDQSEYSEDSDEGSDSDSESVSTESSSEADDVNDNGELSPGVYKNVNITVEPIDEGIAFNGAIEFDELDVNDGIDSSKIVMLSDGSVSESDNLSSGDEDDKNTDNEMDTANDVDEHENDSDTNKTSASNALHNATALIDQNLNSVDAQDDEDDITPFVKNDTDNDEQSADIRMYIDSLKKNKVEVLRQMVVETGLQSEDDVKRIKKPSLIEMLVQAKKAS